MILAVVSTTVWTMRWMSSGELTYEISSKRTNSKSVTEEERFWNHTHLEQLQEGAFSINARKLLHKMRPSL